MRPTVYLFDIDGTLVSCGGAGRRALEFAFNTLFGRSDVFDFSFGGMTDPSIVEIALRNLGEEPNSNRIDEVLELYLQDLERRLHDPEMQAQALRLEEESGQQMAYRVLPGVHRVLEALEAGRDQGAAWALGLGTGNLERGAKIKLMPGQLHTRFAFGGYGSDHGHRPTLIRTGAERGAAHLDRSLAECRVVVIGDTTKDIDAARAIGADVLAVASGKVSLEELGAHKPDLLLPHLDDQRAVDYLVG